MAKAEEKPIVYSALEVANICGVVNQTAINWIRSGHLKAFRTPGGQFRVYPEDLVRFMNHRNMRVPDDLMAQCRIEELETFSKVLIVDDDEGFNNVLMKYIEKSLSSVKVFQAFDGFDAGSKMIEKQPGFVVLDLNLPGINGLNLCKKVMESDAFGHPEIIVVTAVDDVEMEQACRNYGVKYFFKKPVFIPELIKVLSSLI